MLGATMRTADALTTIVWIAFASGGIAAEQTAAPDAIPLSWQYGACLDASVMGDPNAPSNHLFRNRGTTPRVDELAVNMAAAYLRKPPAASSPVGFELTVQAGRDADLFAFSAVAPHVSGADVLLHLGPTDVSYRAPVGDGLTIQGGIFNSLIGYDSLYARDNLAYTRPWGADYTPYLMMGVNASYSVDPRVTVTGFIINGYFHLAHANDAPSLGAQVQWKPNDTVTIKQTTLYGSHQPETALANWRLLSDTIVEKRSSRVTAAGEYQFGSEAVAAHGNARAQWMAAQLPVQWRMTTAWAAAIRAEFAWDRNGRWIGAPQSILGLTTTLDYRLSHGVLETLVRGEYRVDDARGGGGGFFAGMDNHLTPTQNLFIAAVIVSYGGTLRR